MGKQRDEQVDWYADMSDRLERRERRRKWIILSVAVAVALILILGLAVYAYFAQRGLPEWFPTWARDALSRGGGKPEGGPSGHTAPGGSGGGDREGPTEPVLVAKVEEGQIRYTGMSADGLMVTGPEFFFAEQPLDIPGKGRGFLVRPLAGGKYAIDTYVLRNEADKVTYTFKDVDAEYYEGICVLSKKGKRQIREQLEAKFGRKLGKIGD